jgi:hypothetical protein
MNYHSRLLKPDRMVAVSVIKLFTTTVDMKQSSGREERLLRMKKD